MRTVQLMSSLALGASLFAISGCFARINGAANSPAEVTNSKLSLASQRAIERGYDTSDNSWFVYLRSEQLKGDLAPEPGVVRRDPSAVLKIDGKYHV